MNGTARGTPSPGGTPPGGTPPGAPPATLADLPVGGTGRVTSLEGSPAVVQRLQEMGVTSGTEVLVVRFAPLGDPMEIRIRGYHLSLRKNDARGVKIAPAGEGRSP